MKKILIACFAGITSLFSILAFGAPGEYWEITSKMEMPGMPFGMPAMTNKVCIGKGEETDPRKSSKDKDCEMTDIKTSGKKTSWKMRCNREGEVMTGSGEQTTSANSYQGTMRFSGKDINMTQTYSGKRVGGTCDTGEAVAKAKEAGAKAKEQMCDTSQYRSPSDWISAGTVMILGKDAPCANKKEQLCGLVRKDAPNDANTYSALVQHDRANNGEVAKACGLNMAATTKSICKKLREDNYNTLSPHCPAEAKSWREAKRKKECEGLSYTSKEDLKACIDGTAGRSYTSSEETTASDTGGNNPAATVLEGAKKLKGLLRF